MRIEELTLERYGPFTDRKLTLDPQAALHIVLGANEAGKTSALSAIGDLLFGFGARTSYDFKHDMRQLRIGGRLRHSSGNLICVRRRKGIKNTLVDDSDQPLPDDLLAPMLGSMTRETFDNEFGLTAEALREGGEQLLRAGGRLAETLAASSSGMTALSRLRDRLQSEADELFTVRRTASRLFYVASDRRDEADRKLRDATVTSDALRQAESSVTSATGRLDELRQQHAELGGQLALWQRILRTRTHLDRLDRIRRDLNGFADLPAIPTRVFQEWSDAYGGFTKVERQIAAIDSEDQAEAAEIGALAIDGRLLMCGSDIDALKERLGAIRKGLDDLPRRQQAQENARASLDSLAHRLGLSSHSKLLDRMPSDPALTLVRELIMQHRDIRRATIDADQRHAQAKQEYDELTGPDVGQPAIDIEHLRQRLDALGDIEGKSERLRREASALRAETESLGAELASLDPSPASIYSLASLPLPDVHAIAKHAQARETATSEIKRLGDEVESIDGRIAAEEDELVRLSRSGRTLTRSDLVQARHARDAQLEGLRASLDGDREWRSRQFEEVQNTSQAIDNVTDELLSDTERATRQEDVQQRLAAMRRDRSQLAGKLEQLDAGLHQLNNGWLQLWTASGLVPREPTEMLRWRERIDTLLARIGKRKAQEVDVTALTESIEIGKNAAALFLNSTGRTADMGLAPEILFREAKNRFEEMQKAWVAEREKAVSKSRLAREMSDATSSRQKMAAALSALLEQWPAAMAGIGLAADATPAQAETALDVWREAPALRVSFLREGHSAESITADLSAFERDVASIAERSGWPEPSSSQQTLALLSEAITQSRRNNDARERLVAQTNKRAIARQGLLLEREAILTTLHDACRQVALSDISGFPDVLGRLAARRQLETDRDDLHQSLVEIADGHDEAVLRQQRAGLDPDQLPGEIERETLRQKQLLKDIEEALLTQHEAKAALAALTAGRNAATAAAEREDASAELLSVAERWLLRATASRLASRTIEKYRAKVQDPLVARAGALFATATNGAFEGLGIDYADDDQPVLKAQRQNGERVAISGLSEGTRDQLFLALRLALLERWPSEPVPFIGDDLLTSFDEDRTLSTLNLLATAGKQRQILLMTHHRHVAELARSLSHRVDVVTL